jgi:hypothetical protein
MDGTCASTERLAGNADAALGRLVREAGPKFGSSVLVAFTRGP